MSGRLVPVRFRSLGRVCRLACLAHAALLAYAAPAFAQDPVGMPALPPEVAPPTPDTPSSTPSVPAPPSQDPVAPEPAPTPAASPVPQPVLPSTPAPLPSSDAAFEPLPEPPAPRPKREQRPAKTKSSAPGPVSVADEPPSAPVTESAAGASRESSHANSGDDKNDDHYGGPFAPFRLGVLAGGGLPDLLSLGGQLKLTRFFGAGVNIGLIPTVKIAYYGDATLSYQEYDVYGHIYPFGGAFFLGAGVGYATIHGTLASKFNLSPVRAMYPGVPGIPASVDVTSEAQVRTLVLTPQLGFLKVFDVGFAIGVDVGAQIPIAPSQVAFSTAAPGLRGPIASVVQTQYINPNDQKVRSTLDKIGRTPLPTFNLKIGWFL